MHGTSQLDRAERAEKELGKGRKTVVERIEEARDGVAAEVIYPSVGMMLCNHEDSDYKHACFVAYNRWLAEFCSSHPDRLLGLGQASVKDPDDCIRELEEIKRLGLRR